MRRVTTGALSIGVLLALLCCGGLKPDELACEEAVARLDGCCPGFDNHGIACLYQVSGGCLESVTTHPAITEDQSLCIRNTACADLVARGVCTRAQNARANTTSNDSTIPTVRPPQVCP